MNINTVKTLDELLDTLNSYESDSDNEQDRIEHHVDLTSLPTFGYEPKDTTEIYSWDDTRVLIQNTNIGPAFVLVDRSHDFGE